MCGLDCDSIVNKIRRRRMTKDKMDGNASKERQEDCPN
jgi:hypothetical protein